MINLCILLFAFSLIYLSIAERFRTFTLLIGLQGFFLFGICFALLDEIKLINLAFIVVETVIFKAVVVPALMYRIIRHTNINRVHKDALPTFYAVIVTTLALVVSVMLVIMLHDSSINPLFFSVSLFAMFTGLLLIITHKRLFSHMVGFLVIENAVFLFSVAVGTEMPMLINVGVLLDIFMTVLIFGIFILRINSKVHNLNIDALTTIRD
jgi:hydrogenase-4 component E